MPDWASSLIAGGGGFGVLWALNAIYKTWLSRKHVDVDAADQLAQVAANLTRNANEQVAAIRADAQAQIASARADAQAQMASARADAANAVATALNDVSIARREAAESRQSAAESRQAAERAESFVRKLAWEAYRPTATVERWRELVSSGPFHGAVNGSGVPVG